MNQFKHIALVANLDLPEVADSLQRLATYLCANGYFVAVDEVTSRLMRGYQLPVYETEELIKQVDLVIVVGGDGSMLSAARGLVEYNVPLLGVNRGRLGFLTDILPNQIEEEVGRVLAGEYITSCRFLLEISVTRGDRTIGQGDALNDVVLHPGKSVRMMEFELYINKQFVYSQRSDGLIVSTPTGSTAYALSGGGPIMHPNLDAIVLVPMNPHTLTSRPIVVDGNSDIEIRVGERNELHPLVTCDGQNDVSTEPGDVIRILKKPQHLTLIHPVDHNFYAICRSKIGWSSRLDSTNRGG